MRNNKLYILIAAFILVSSCKKILEVNAEGSEILSDKVFADDHMATAAMAIVYATMLNDASSPIAGTSNITIYSGMLSDELTSYSFVPDFSIFQQNQLLPENGEVVKIWGGFYKVIYGANAVLEGVEKSTTLSSGIRAQLKGEALFVRAFCHFYLLNLFGKVPLVTTTDYTLNARLPRSDSAGVYSQIIQDLQTARELLSNTYVGAERVRPNKMAATAMLARVYAYNKDWVNAELMSSSVIDDPAYQLSELSNGFLAYSQETIWQLMPANLDYNTPEGYSFIIQSNPTLTGSLALRTGAADFFEPGDGRKTAWIGSYAEDTGEWLFPFKYKASYRSSPDMPASEYYIVFRLAEQYLIRAEARMMQTGKLAEGIDDINIIRDRAREESGVNPLPPIDRTISQEDALEILEYERRAELFCEWGHRWFDLKRWNKATLRLSPIKSEWSPNDQFLPIPQQEINKNPSLLPQNSGY